jgi:LysM repeat protein
MKAIKLLKVLVVIQVVILIATLIVILVTPDDVALASSDVAGSFQNVGLNAMPDFSPEPLLAPASDAIAISSEKLSAANPGIVLQSPPESRASRPTFTVYSVRRGDTMMRIAWRFRTTMWSLVRANHLRNVNRIFVGQRMVVPGWGFWDSWWWQPPAVNNAVAHQNVDHGDRHVNNDNHNDSVKAPDTFQAVCNPMISISSPLVNQTVDPNQVTVSGSANLPAEFDPGSQGFSYYKVLFGEGERPIVWHQIGDLHHNTVTNGTLETWNTSVLPNGVYVLRLYSVSTNGQFPPACQVRVVISR